MSLKGGKEAQDEVECEVCRAERGFASDVSAILMYKFFKNSNSHKVVFSPDFNQLSVFII